MSQAPKSVSQERRERLLQVLLAPAISEKSTLVADKHNQVVFRVARDATKPEIRDAVEMLFKVDVEGVQVLNCVGRDKRFGRFVGRRSGWRKAYVRVKAGQEISFVGGEIK